MARVVGVVDIEVDGLHVRVERLEDGTFRKPSYLAGAEREVVGERMRPDGKSMLSARGGDESRGDGWDRPWRRDPDAIARNGMVTAPATDDARRWHGWNVALKPAWEPIVVARKPLAEKTVAANVLAHGCGGINVDACRVEGGPIASAGGTRRSGGIMGASQPLGGWEPSHTGRWPSNVVLSHVALTDDDGTVIGDACDPVCVPGCPVAELDAQSGTLTSGGGDRGTTSRNGLMGENSDRGRAKRYERAPDAGGASRFFPVFRYQAKAPARERPKVDGVAHPTVKPLSLMSWLCRLVTVPGGTVLDPFAGSGSTLEAAMLEGFNAVGVERNAEYLPLIRLRIDRATEQLAELARRAVAADVQGDLLGELEAV